MAAVRRALPSIARAADLVARRLEVGGRLAYAGAGSSIRYAVQDGSELPATFGLSEDRLIYCIAGGRAAMFETLASAEDDREAGAHDGGQLAAGDVMIAVAASGTTPYTVAAAKAARRQGAAVIAIVNNPATTLAVTADVEVLLASGPEVISGSTRLGAGTAQKAALNLISTLCHIRLGAVHDGLMVNLDAGNEKLKRRACAIVAEIAGVDEKRAAECLKTSGGKVKPAILLCAGVAGLAEAEGLLLGAGDRLRPALAKMQHSV